jgi:inhibitor of cysteine peptidase
MLLRISLLFIMCITTLSMSSCFVTSHDYSFEVSCEEFAENSKYNRDLVLEVGDKIKLALCSNRSTGFSWEYKVTAENIVSEEDHDFEEPEADVVGAAGKELWTFKAVEKGTTEIQMEYSKPWEGGTKAEWTYTIKVTVE